MDKWIFLKREFDLLFQAFFYALGRINCCNIGDGADKNMRNRQKKGDDFQVNAEDNELVIHIFGIFLAMSTLFCAPGAHFLRMADYGRKV